MFDKRLAVSSIALFSAVARTSANTRVFVLEFGKGGVVHQTESNRSRTSVPAVESFWSSLHHDNFDGSLNTQALHPGMSLVPDFFHRPHGGLVIGLTGVDLDEMQTLQSYLTSNGVGEFTLPGSQSFTLLQSDEGTKNPMNSLDEFSLLLDSSVDGVLSGDHRFSKLPLLTSKTDVRTDQVVATALKRLQTSADTKKRTVVVHVVVEEDEDAARRRKMAHKHERKLEDEDRDNEDEDRDENEEEDKDEEENDNGNNNNNGNGNGNGGGYYGSNSLFLWFQLHAF